MYWSQSVRLLCVLFAFFWRYSPTRARAASCARCLDHTQWHTTVGRTPLDEGSVRRRDLYLISHNTHNRRAYILLAGFEPAIPASDRRHTLAVDRSALLHVRTINVHGFCILNWKRRDTSPATVLCLSKCSQRHWNVCKVATVHYQKCLYVHRFRQTKFWACVKNCDLVTNNKTVNLHMT